MRALQAMHQNFFISANSFVQRAALAALREAAADIEAMRAVYEEAWRMDTFPPTGDELQRAWRILQALERTGARPGEGSWNLADIPEYAEAEAAYEEAVRLCRML